MQRTDRISTVDSPRLPARQSVGARAFALLSVLLVVVMATAVAAIGRRNYSHETGMLDERSASQARFLASVSPEPIFSRDFLTLETLVRQAVEDPATVHVVFLDNEQQAMTRFVDRDDPDVSAAVDGLDVFDSGAVADALARTSVLREVRRPVISEGIRLGEVRVVYSTDSALSNARRFTIDASIAAAMVLGLVLVSSIWIFRRKIGDPLRDLTDKT
ncbi:MAG: hypothetical protein KDB37_21075, partial [Ilumatobacter sp.]|nr:hypothetical protein [Ilumatobacter sp.]